MAAWVTDIIHADTMIPVGGVAAVVDMLLAPGPNSGISRMIMGCSAPMDLSHE